MPDAGKSVINEQPQVADLALKHVLSCPKLALVKKPSVTFSDTLSFRQSNDISTIGARLQSMEGIIVHLISPQHVSGFTPHSVVARNILFLNPDFRPGIL